MRSAIITFLIAASWAISVFSAEPVLITESNYPMRTEQQDIDLLKLQVMSNSTVISLTWAEQVVRAAYRASKRHGIPASVILAIAYVESDYRLNAVNKRSNDYGIMQVNEYHIRRGVDKQRLLTDLDYSFEEGTKVLKWFYNKYPLEEAISRYNCGTRPSCIKQTRVRNYLKKVKSSL